MATPLPSAQPQTAQPQTAQPQTAQPPAAPLLTVSGLQVSFGPVRALDGVDLSMRAGEIVALAGENGAGKTTLVRCLAGDITPTSGEMLLAGKRVSASPVAAARQGIGVVWQDLALCDNLDVASNVLLGQEPRRLILSENRFHAAAAAVLRSLRIPIADTTRTVRTLSGGERQLVAVARAISHGPRLLVLDEPSASLGAKAKAQVEELVMELRGKGTTILIASHDIEQMLRLADRIVVLRQGRIVGDLDPRSTHPDDVVALLSGHEVGSSARRQLTRLHGLTDRLVSADPSSSLSLILSALGAALGTKRLCIHLVTGPALLCAASLGFEPGELVEWSRLPFGGEGGPVGLAATSEQTVVAANVGASAAWAAFGTMARDAGVGSSWSVPVMGPDGLRGIITVFRAKAGTPLQDELDLVTLYAGYAASAIERDRLLDQVTSRNRVLETIREMLETLAGPIPVAEALVVAVGSLRRGLQADEVALLTQPQGEAPRWRAFAGRAGTDPAGASPSLRGLAEEALADAHREGVARRLSSSRGRRVLAVVFRAPAGPSVLLASWRHIQATTEETALMEDAAHSLRLALEREEAGLAHQEAAALRRSRELQRDFLTRLSHELRTPLTAIRGYASSLMQPDVTWDGESEQRFLGRIGAESARLGRLVEDLLDFSAIESGIMRLQRDWCEIPLVLEAAIACLPPASAAAVSVACAPDLPVVWADHDRLEQVFVNLLTNALRHNPAGTRVRVTAAPCRVPGSAPGGLTGQAPGGLTGQARAGLTGQAPADANGQAPGDVEISVTDDGVGMPAELADAPFEPVRRRLASSTGAGLGLSIAKGIVEVHGGSIELQRLRPGTRFRIRLPIEAPERPGGEADPRDDGQGTDPVTVAAGALAAGTVAAGTLAGGTLAGGTVPAGTVPAGTVPAGTGAAGTLAAGTVPAGTGAAGTGAATTLGTGSLGTGPDVGAAGGAGPGFDRDNA